MQKSPEGTVSRGLRARAAFGVTWTDPKKALRALTVAALALSLVHPLQPAHAAPRAGQGLVSVIVREASGSGRAPERAVGHLKGRIVRHIGLIDGFVADIPRVAVPELRAAPGVASVTPDERVELLGAPDGYDPAKDAGSLLNTVESIDASYLWKKGLTGKGVDVALIDSGIVPVPGLDDPNKIVNGPDISFESQADNLRYRDTFGHGTHMAGIIAGRDRDADLSGKRDDFMGVAPDAGLVSVKVASASGATDVSQVIAAIDWVVQHRNDDGLNIRVLNLSFGTDGTQSYRIDPLAHAAEVAWRKGIVVVVAAGNRGYGSAKLNNPAHDPYLLAVGAADTNGTARTSDDIVPEWSSRGGGERNPDLVAPGKSIVSLRAPGSYVDRRNPEGRVDERFFRGSGTSQAAAVTSGAAALLVQQRPELTPDQVKRLLTSTATELPDADGESQGAGLIDLKAAYKAPTPSYVQTWPKSMGTGSLEEARGSAHVARDGVVLRGERDIFGTPWDGDTWARNTWSGTTWSGGTWNGEIWAGDGWTRNTWSRNTWSSAVWTRNTWSGTAWSRNTWSEGDWDRNTWSRLAWSGGYWTRNTWSRNTWSRNTWSGDTWSRNTWSGDTWSRNTWSGDTWSRNTWSSAGWGAF